MNRFRFILFCLFVPMFFFAQGELDKEQLKYYRNTRNFSLSAYSNGFGVGFLYSKFSNRFKRTLLEFDLDYIKHPKEVKSVHPYNTNQKSYVFGKLFTVFPVHLGMGRQKELFSKHDKGGVSIHWFYLGGASLALMKPIYYDLIKTEIYSDGYYVEYLVSEKFDVSEVHSPHEVYGKSEFKKGLDELEVIPGVYLKSGFEFEFGKDSKIIQALGCGVMLEVYSEEVQIMATEDNSILFPSIYFYYKFGKITKKIVR